MSTFKTSFTHGSLSDMTLFYSWATLSVAQEILHNAPQNLLGKLEYSFTANPICTKYHSPLPPPKKKLSANWSHHLHCIYFTLSAANLLSLTTPMPSLNRKFVANSTKVIKGCYLGNESSTGTGRPRPWSSGWDVNSARLCGKQVHGVWLSATPLTWSGEAVPCTNQSPAFNI